MRSSFRLLLVALCITASAQQYQPALPGYRYQFPRDHFNHPDYQTEWWYYTGNLRARDGHRFGFELTFFRQAISREANPSAWIVRDLYMAHLALSDISRARYYSTERLNRAGPGIAGVDAASETIWNGNWQARISPNAHHLRGIVDNFSVDLTALPEKPPVIHGPNGVSQKAEGAEHASHYVSFTRMKTTGSIELNGSQYEVEGSTWMDHEFFSEPMDTAETGWDWVSLQLDDNSELMLYRLRHKDGSVDRYSSGTYVDNRGRTLHLALADFSMTQSGPIWKSDDTHASYPVAWSIAVPQLNLRLEISTPLNSQEFVSRAGPSYWEGAIDVQGRRGDQPVWGSGYLEMTGYAQTAYSAAHPGITR